MFDNNKTTNKILKNEWIQRMKITITLTEGINKSRSARADHR